MAAGDDVAGRSRQAVANSTLRQRLTAVRLWYDHLVHAGVRARNPVPRAERPARRGAPSSRTGVGRALVPKVEQLPRVPTHEAWQRVLRAAAEESLRNRVMFALAYFGALRREELVHLGVADIDHARRLITVRGATTKTLRARSPIRRWPAQGSWRFSPSGRRSTGCSSRRPTATSARR